MQTQFTDRVTIEGMRRTNDGYLVGTVRCARVGCQDYAGHELGQPDLKVITVYRPPEAVFNKDSMATFVGKPVTLGHPPEMVDASNWKKYAAGDIGEKVARDGEFIQVPITLMDADVAKAVEDGTREISMGYTTPTVMQDGVAPDGTPYQAVQTGPIKINHLAIVDKARGGDKLRVGDGAQNWDAAAAPLNPPDAKTEDNMSDGKTLTSVVLGDEAVQVTADSARSIEKFKTDSAKRLSDAENKHKSEMKEKDKELAKKDAEIDGLKAKVLSDEDIDKRVSERAALIDQARAIHKDLDPKGMSDADIRRAVVTAKRGKEALDGKSEAYVDAAFDIIAADHKPKDSFADTMQGGVQTHDADPWAFADQTKEKTA